MKNLDSLFKKIPDIDGGKFNSDKTEYTLEIEDSERYGKIYSIIDKKLEASDLSNIEDDFMLNVFEYEDLEVKLVADLNKDIYKLIIREA